MVTMLNVPHAHSGKSTEVVRAAEDVRPVYLIETLLGELGGGGGGGGGRIYA